MKAVVYRQYGGPELHIAEVATPSRRRMKC
jgi:hypothetical protein